MTSSSAILICTMSSVSVNPKTDSNAFLKELLTSSLVGKKKLSEKSKLNWDKNWKVSDC